MHFTRVANDNAVNIMATELKRRGMIVDNCSLEEFDLKVRRHSPFLTVYTLYFRGRVK